MSKEVIKVEGVYRKQCIRLWNLPHKTGTFRTNQVDTNLSFQLTKENGNKG